MDPLLTRPGDTDYRRGYLKLKSVNWDRVTGLPAFPVLAPATTSAPSSRARVMATALARSLNDALGLSPSSFK